MSSHTSLAQDLSLVFSHPRSYSWAHLFDSLLLFYFHLFFPVFSCYLLHSELYPELDNLIVMESLCYSANKGGDDAYDVSTSLTEPTSFLDHLYLGCTQRECQISYDIVANSRDMFVQPRKNDLSEGERNLYGHPLAGLLWERQFEKILLKHGWEKIPNWECLFVHRGKGLFLSVYVDDIKLAGKKQNLDPMWKVLNKEVDLGEPTSFLDHVYLGCTQRQCQTSKDIVDNYRTMFESRISAGEVEKLPFPQNLRISSWSYDMAGHAKNCVERYCELANKTTQQLYKVSTPCIDDHHFKEEELKSVGESSKVCSQIVLKCLYLARIGRPDILWSVNKLARSITKWTKACDKRLNRLISYIHHTYEYKQYCYVGNTA